MIQDTEIAIAFDQEKKDIIAFGYVHQKRSQASRFFGGNLAIIAAVAMAGYMAYEYVWLSQPVAYSVIFAFMSYVLYALSYRSILLYGLLFWPRLKKSPMAIRGPVVIRLHKEGLQLQSAGTEQHFAWSSFSAFVREKEHLFLFDDADGGVLFPQRAFLLAQEAYDFEHYIKQNLINNNKPDYGQSNLP